MLKDILSQKDRYSELEKELKAKTSMYTDPHALKNAVIIANVSAYLGHYKPIHPYKAVAGRLKLNTKATEELNDLYLNVIEPVRDRLHDIHGRIIGTRTWFFLGPRLRTGNEQTLEDDGHRAISEFTDSFFSLMENMGVNDKKRIKRALIYPLTISQISSWDKHGGKFGQLVDGLIGSIKAREEDPELKNMIDAVHNPMQRRVHAQGSP
jgi:hypothetical protein